MTRTTIPSFAVEDSAEYPETAAGTHLPFYCINCYRKRETTYLTPDFGPFCDECLKEVEPLLKEQTPPPATCPHCHGTKTHNVYRPEVYEFNYVCRDCDRGFNA